MEPKFLIIQVFFMRQHGLGHASDPAWKLRFPPALPGLTALHSAQFRLLDMQATSKHPKPGGWSVKEWTLLHRGLNCGVEGPFSGCERAFVEMWARVGLEHATWCENSVQPVLARSVYAAEARGDLFGICSILWYCIIFMPDAGHESESS